MLIYIVSKLKYRQLWTEINLLDDFVPQSVMMSNRAFYMILIKASCEYLITLKEAPPTPKPEETPQVEDLQIETKVAPSRFSKRNNSFDSR
jgi:hypothetical protein